MQPHKRKSFPYPSYDRDYHPESEHKRSRPIYYNEDLPPYAGPSYASRPAPAGHGYHEELRDLPRAQPPQEFVDLTSSPRRHVTNGDSRYHVPARAHAVSDFSGLPYVPVPSHRAPQREVRGHNEVHSGEPSHVYIPDGGVYERPVPPVRDYIPVRYDQHQQPVDGNDTRRLRSSLHYGGPDLY
jgi:hypothetical protein